ncbi:MAG: hypothetical protein ACKOFA_06840 [Rhodoluna sp.]
MKLENLTQAQRQIVAALYEGIVIGQEDQVDKTFDAQNGQTLELIEKLSPILEIGSETKFGPWQEIGFSEIARASLDYQVNGEMVLAERWLRNVHLDQLDKTGLLITKSLLSAGVGKVITHDDGVVLSTDLGELGYPKLMKNQARIQSATTILSELSLPQAARLIDLNTKANQSTQVSFAVVVGHLALSPRTYSRWLSRDVPHLAITYELESVWVSPVIIPGKTSCLNCVQELAVDKNIDWPIIATQLLNLPRFRDDAASLLTAVGLATRSILRKLDELAGFQMKQEVSNEVFAGYRINLASGSIDRISYVRHELCSCAQFSQSI